MLGGDPLELGGRPGTPPTPVLVEAQVRRLAESAELLVRSLPPHAFVDPRPHGRRMCKDLEAWDFSQDHTDGSLF
ncbi:unnamed protein product [Ixodes persulcatus]